MARPRGAPLVQFSVLRGLWRGAYVAFDGDLMHELAAELMALAEKQGATVPRVIAYHLMGCTLGLTGNIAEGRAHLDQAIALYDPAEYRPLTARFGLACLIREGDDFGLADVV
jgi:hypothetical protein